MTDQDETTDVTIGARVRELVRQVIEDHPGASIRDLAGYAAKLTAEDDLLDFYTEGLVSLVDSVLSEQRRAALNNSLRPKNRSPKLEQRRKWWADLLAARVRVGASMKAVGECTVDDLSLCIDERRVVIGRIEGQILNYEKLIQLMTKHGARTVADLPEQDRWEES